MPSILGLISFLIDVASSSLLYKVNLALPSNSGNFRQPKIRKARNTKSKRAYIINTVKISLFLLNKSSD